MRRTRPSESHPPVQTRSSRDRDWLVVFLSASFNFYDRNPISTARGPNGVITSVPMWVQHHHWTFWSRVFDHDGRSAVDEPANDRDVAQCELFSTTTERVADDDREILDADLTIDEFVTAIKSMSPYKAPGLDGIPAKVYQLAPLLFARLLVRVFDHHVRRGSLHLHQRRSVVCLLSKKATAVTHQTTVQSVSSPSISRSTRACSQTDSAPSCPLSFTRTNPVLSKVATSNTHC